MTNILYSTEPVLPRVWKFFPQGRVVVPLGGHLEDHLLVDIGICACELFWGEELDVSAVLLCRQTCDERRELETPCPRNDTIAAHSGERNALRDADRVVLHESGRVHDDDGDIVKRPSL